MKKALFFLAAAMLFLCCKQLYLPFEKPDFSPIDERKASDNHIKQFFGPTAGIYKMYYAQTEINHDGIKFKSYGPVQHPQTKMIKRVASLLFLDNFRVLYLSSDHDWPNIDPDKRIIPLDKHYYPVRERSNKNVVSYFKGYYHVEGNLLTIELDEGATVSRHKAPKFDQARIAYDSSGKNKDFKKIMHMSERVWMHFSIIDTGFLSLQLISMDYYSNNLGINYNMPDEKLMNKIFQDPVLFHYESNDSNQVQITLQDKPIKAVTYGQGKRTYWFQDNSSVPELLLSRKDIFTW